MASLTIRHVTTYRYRRPVAFGEHRMMLRPRDTREQMVVEASLEISPRPASLRLVRDALGNHVGIADFSTPSQELRFESTVNLEHFPFDPIFLGLDEAGGSFPVRYASDELPELKRYMSRDDIDPHDVVGQWAGEFLPRRGSIGTFSLLSQISSAIREGCQYRRREAKGINQPAHTLRGRHGSCRDFAVLLIAAARSLGFAARFASGYLTTPIDWSKPSPNAAAQGATHAWAQIYLPGASWLSFDPTCGGVGNAGLVTVAVADNPSDALPLHGSFFGLASDSLGMDVMVRVTHDRREAIWGEVGPNASCWCN